MVTLKQPGYAGCDDEVLRAVQTELLDKELSVPVVLKAYLHSEAPLRLEAWIMGEAEHEEDGAAGGSSVALEGRWCRRHPTDRSVRPMYKSSWEKQEGAVSGRNVSCWICRIRFFFR